VSELLQGAQGELHLPAVRDDRVPQAELLCGERLLRGGSGESSLDGALNSQSLRQQQQRCQWHFRR